MSAPLAWRWTARRYRIEVFEPTDLLGDDAGGANAFERVWREMPIGRDWRSRITLGQPGGIFLKGNQIPAIAWLQHWLRRFHVQREYEALARLRHLGLPSAAPLALGVESLWGIPRRAFLLQRHIADALDVEQILRGDAPAGEERTRALRAAGAVVRRLHLAGLYHGDLACRNLLVQKSADGWQAYPVDVPRLVAARRKSAWLRRKDLFRLAKTALRCDPTPRELAALVGSAAGEDPARILHAVRQSRKVQVRLVRKVRIAMWRAIGR